MDFADVDRFLKALQIRLREFQSRLRKLGIDEQRAHLKRDTALVIGHLRARHGGCVPGGLQAARPLVAALDQVTQPHVALGRGLEVVRHALALRAGEERQVFPVGEERRIRAQIGGDFRGLVLLDGGPGGLQGVVVLERHLDGLIQRNPDRRLLRERRIRRQQAAEHASGRHK